MFLLIHYSKPIIRVYVLDRSGWFSRDIAYIRHSPVRACFVISANRTTTTLTRVWCGRGIGLLSQRARKVDLDQLDLRPPGNHPL